MEVIEGNSYKALIIPQAVGEGNLITVNVDGRDFISFDDPTVEEAAKNIYAIAAKQSQGTFKPQRDRDILTAGLGNPEHHGRLSLA